MKESRIFQLIVCLAFTVIVLPFFLADNNAYAADGYQFERIWPTLNQPWYFASRAGDIAIDENENLYYSDGDRVVKLSANGDLITAFESSTPGGLAIDSENEYIYVILRSSIIQLTLDLDFVRTFASFPSVSGDTSMGLALDSDNNVYYLNRHSQNLTKYSPSGEILYVIGNADGLNAPKDIVINQDLHFMYITEAGSQLISKWTLEGDPVSSWSSVLNEHGITGRYGALFSKSSDGLYSCNSGKLYKYDFDGVLLNTLDIFFPNRPFDSIRDQGLLPPEFPLFCDGLVIGKGANEIIYATTTFEINRFESDGTYLDSWGSKAATMAGDAGQPIDIEVADNGDIWVIDGDSNLRALIIYDKFGRRKSTDIVRQNTHIELAGGMEYRVYDAMNIMAKYSLDGEVIEIGTRQTGANLIWIQDFAVTTEGVIFVVFRKSEDTSFFGPKYFGTFDIHEGIIDSVPLEGNSFEYSQIDVNSQGRLYISHANGYEVYSQNLDRLFSYDKPGAEDGQFDFVRSFAIDKQDNLYFGLNGSRGVHVLDRDGNFIGRVGEGFGFGAGQMAIATAVAIDDSGNVFVADAETIRFQKFRPVSVADNSKAIVVSAGGPFAGNNLWDTTQIAANFAYRTLTYQGFTKDSIYYLSSDIDLDLDQNGVADDVDADATNANLKYAIREWAADADNLVIYLVDHGGVDTFRMSGDEILYSSELASWVNELQAIMPGRVTLVYDACESGSFISALTPPAGFDRTVITSTSPGENAVFVSQGSISFSNFFWTHVFNGLSLEDSFSLASQALTSTTDHQHPMMDYNGDGLSDGADLAATSNVFIGNGTDLQAEAPTIFGVSAGQVISGISTASVIAEDVTDSDGIARVWAIVRPPDYQQGESGNPVQDLPGFDLSSDGNGKYTGSWDQFTTAGTYQLAIYASDRAGNTSVPLLTTVSVESPLSKRAVLIAAGAANDPDYSIASNSTDVAYEALKQQGYDDEAIYYMNNNGVPGFDVAPSLSNLEYYLTDISGLDTQDLVIYIVGEGTSNAITIREREILTPDQLGNWLNTLTDKIPGNVTVVLDTDNAGSFIASLSGNKRIIVTSTGAAQQAHFLNQGDISFSHSYWRKVFNGATVRDAYRYAKSAMRFSVGSQEAQLDDNGDQIANTKQDGLVARLQTHGTGILLAGDEPLIGSVSANDEITTGQTATITVNNVTTTGEIESVTAVVTSPDKLTTLYALNQSGNNYSTNSIDFSVPGTYDVALYVRDTAGNLSPPSTTTVEVREQGFDLVLNINQQSYIGSNTLTLSTQADIDSNPSYQGQADLYLEVTLPDGQTLYLTDLNLNISTVPTPILVNWTPSSIPDTAIFSLPLPEGLPAGDYSWKLTFVKAEQSYANASNWLAQGRAVHGIQ